MDIVALVPGAKIQLASSSLALLQRLTRDAVRWSVNGRGAAIQVEMARLEQNMEVLRHGPGRRLAQEVSMDSIEGLKLLSKAEDAWAELKGSLTGLFDLSRLSHLRNPAWNLTLALVSSGFHRFREVYPGAEAANAPKAGAGKRFEGVHGPGGRRRGS